jgi:DNA-binding CsgD family transcriptional regulator/tetratricopeptide (TPR) repeat protein
VLEQAIGYGVARQLFEDLLASADRARRGRLLAGAAAHASSALAVTSVEGQAESLARSADESVSLHGLYWLAANLAAERQLVLVVDDAQWSDPASLRWLLYLARRIAGLPITVLAGIRTGEPDVSYEVLDLLAGEPSTQELRPAPLSADGCTALLGEVFERAVDPALGHACHDWTGGNPLLLRELALEMDDGQVASDAAAIERMRELLPDRLMALTLLRVGRQRAETVELLRAISIFGEAALGDASVLAGIATREAELAADRLAEAALLESGRPLRFVHPLIREVVYADVPPARRAADHKRAAGILASGGADHDVVATHLLRSDSAADPWVVELLRAAAASELERGSPDAAAVMLSRALAEPPAAGERWAILHELGRAQFLAGDFAALSTLQSALGAGADSDQRSETALLLGNLLTFAGRAEDAVAVLEPAIDELDARNDRRLELEATLLASASLDQRLRPLAERHTTSARKRTLTDSHGSRLVNAQLAYRSAIAGSPVDETLAHARAALEGDRLVRESLGRPAMYVPAISMLAICDALDEADAHYAGAVELAQAAGRAIDFACISMLRSWASRALGRLRDAEVQARDALRLAAEYPQLTGAIGGMATAHLAFVLLERGEYAEVEALVGPDPAAPADEEMTWARELLYAGGRLRASQSRFRDAAELFLASGESHERAGIVNPAFIPWRSAAALALHRMGDDERAKELVTEELALARGVGVPRAIGVTLRAAGLITGGEDGVEQLRESVESLAGSPSRLERARSIVALGGALRRAGSRAEARGILEEGLALATDCSATALIEEANAELETLGARPRSMMLTGVESLTASERRVAGMAARGMTNPQIAQALFVTRATVESHLHRSYQKLDITSRTQLVEALGLTE